MEIILPFILIALGTAQVMYPQQAGHIFCMTGKAIWRVSTFGITDMHWFYSEERAPKVMRRVGVAMCIGGTLLAYGTILSFYGPNQFAANRQAMIYLNKTYGASSEGYKVSCSPNDSKAESVVIKFHYAGSDGALQGVWDGKQYVFTKEP